jgi:F-type H+-transporting ATPase subunit b
MTEALASLGIDPRVLLLQVIAFIILFLVLRRFLFRPLMAVMNLRAREIAEGLEAGERSKEALARIDEERQRQLAEAREQGREHVRQAVREAGQAREQILQEARREVQEMRDRGRQALDREREQAELELRRRVVELALLAAGRAVLQRLDERAHRQAVEDFIAGLEREPIAGLPRLEPEERGP